MGDVSVCSYCIQAHLLFFHLKCLHGFERHETA